MTAGTGTETERDDYHGHPPYVKIWGILLGLLGLSLLAAFLNHPLLATVIIFVLAGVKAYLVIVNYMHLKFEPSILISAFLFAVVCMFFLFFGIYPDIIPVPLDVVK